MAISEKIIKEIENLDEKEEMKELMLEILKKEDEGTYKFREMYEEIINKYIKLQEVGEENND